VFEASLLLVRFALPTNARRADRPVECPAAMPTNLVNQQSCGVSIKSICPLVSDVLAVRIQPIGPAVAIVSIRRIIRPARSPKPSNFDEVLVIGIDSAWSSSDQADFGEP
jgi:hypothetical protein